MIEQTGAVAEQDRHHCHHHLVQHTGLQTLRGDAGAEHIDALVPRRGARLFDRRGQVADEGHPRHRVGRRPVRQHELRPVPAAAERLTLAGPALIRVVAAVGPVADEDRPGLRNEVVHNGIRVEEASETGHFTAGAGDEPVNRHRRRIEKLRHGRLDRRQMEKSSATRSGGGGI